MSQFSVCPDPSMFSDSDGWEFSEPEPDEAAEAAAQWDEAAEGDMRYDIAEEQRLFPAPALAFPNLHPIGVQVAELTAHESSRPLVEVA
ncbi:MAG: hypothetical protein ABSG56_38255 [Bryobacteraceae bacterium]